MPWKPGELLKLTRSTRKYLGIINKLSSSGLSSTAAYKEYHNLGLPASREAFFDAVRYFRYARTNPYEFLPNNTAQIPKIANIPHSGFTQKKRFQSVVEYEYYHEASGQVRRDAVTVSSKYALPEREVYKQAMSFLPSYEFDPDSDLLGIRIVEMRQSDRTIL